MILTTTLEITGFECIEYFPSAPGVWRLLIDRLPVEGCVRCLLSMPDRGVITATLTFPAHLLASGQLAALLGRFDPIQAKP